jgi:FG-GAP repeat
MTTTMRNAMKLGSIVFGMLLVAHTAAAQFTQQGSKLIGTGATGRANQGSAVAFSTDGNTAIIGGLEDSALAGGTGAAWVFTRSGGVWTQQGNKLVGTGVTGTNCQQGISVAISGDGNTALVGGWGDNNVTGAVWVFTRTGGVWTQQGTKLVASDAVKVAAVAEGVSVSLSTDGNTALVGGYVDNNGVGAAWVFTRSGGVWTQQGSKLVGTGAVGNAAQGFSVAISGDGNTAIVGGRDDNGTAGAAWVWTRTGVNWTQQGSKLVGTGAVGNAAQGHSVAISGDGNTAVVGGPWDDQLTPGAGAAWIFTRSGGVWTQQGTKLVGTGGTGLYTASQGFSAAMSSDGNTAVVGGYTSDFNGTYPPSTPGAAWVFTRSGGVWTQLGSKLVGTGAVAGLTEQGYAVGISGDATTAGVGGWSDNNDVGATWIFVSGISASATQLAFIQQPTNAVAGQAINPAVTVQLKDSGGSPVAQAGVTITMSLSSGTGTLGGTLSQVTDASGLATFNNLSINLAGSKQLTADPVSLTPAASSAFTITAAAATSIVATGGTPQSTPINTPFAQPLQVLVTDTFGNPVVGAVVTYSAPGSGASASIGNGGSATTNLSGVASVTATANGTTGTYQVTATYGTLPPVPFTLTNSAAVTAATSSVPALGTAGLLLLGLALATLGAAAVSRISP